MASVDEFAAAVGIAAVSVESVSTAIATAKTNGDELSAELTRLKVEGTASRAIAVNSRLEVEAMPLAAQLKNLLEEIQQQAQGIGSSG